MTRRTNARIAGIAYLLYIAVAYPSMVLSNRATSGEGMAAKLANMALHATDVRLAAVLSLIGCFCALVLAVTLGLLAIATAAGTDAPDPRSGSRPRHARPDLPSCRGHHRSCFRSGWPVSASSHRLWWRWPCRCRLLRCSRDSSHVSCGCRSPFSSWCSRCG